MRRYIYGLALILMVLPVYAAKKKTLPAVSATDLRTERLVNPMSIDTPHPRLGWRIESSEKDVMQTRCHIIVASTRAKAEALDGDLWDVTLEGDRSQWVPYQERP